MEQNPCPYCENFEGTGFKVENGKVQRFNLCPVCGKPYTAEGAELFNQRAQENQSGQALKK